MARAGKRRAPPDGCLSCGYNDRMRLAQVLLALLLGGASLVGHVAAQASDQDKERGFLSRVRRLTVDGRRAGEGYWSPDGTRLVFQSEREPGNPFYQIYALDLASGETKRISPGNGQDDVRVLPAGQRRDRVRLDAPRPEVEAIPGRRAGVPRLGQGAPLLVGLRPEMDIYTYNEKTGATRQLTTAKGYDAEGSYSPDGQWIVFSSMREAYNRTLATDEKKQLEREPAATSPRSTSCGRTGRNRGA